MNADKVLKLVRLSEKSNKLSSMLGQYTFEVARYATKRLELKKALVDPAGTDESREAARVGLQKLPRDASPVRLRGRDAIDGRPRGYLSQFGV